MRVFELDENEIDKYKGFCFTTSDAKYYNGGNYRVILADGSGNHVASIEGLVATGTRTFYFNGYGDANETWNMKFNLLEGKQWSEVRQIMVGGKAGDDETGGGTLKLTDCYLFNK